jgi:hypothetical protein
MSPFLNLVLAVEIFTVTEIEGERKKIKDQ